MDATYTEGGNRLVFQCIIAVFEWSDKGKPRLASDATESNPVNIRTGHLSMQVNSIFVAQETRL
jgi:hypothetical protein